jgi:hypothetical protein
MYNNININILIIILVLFLYFMSKKELFSNNENDFVKRGVKSTGNKSSMINPSLEDDKNIKNIYGEKLGTCKNNVQESSGNFNVSGKCPFGKYEEERNSFDCPKNSCNDLKPRLCMKFDLMSRNFAKYSGHSINWSKKYNSGETNCVKLGEYSYYKTRQDQNLIFNNKKQDLVCDAIPEDVFKFIEDWDKGHNSDKTDKYTIKDQTINGLKALFTQCYKSGSDTGKIGLLKRFCSVLRTNKGESMRKADEKSKNNNLQEIFENYCQDID